MSLAIRDQISGNPIVIERPLLAEYIKAGQVLWYHGYTSVSNWDCPAIITQVDKKKKRFRIRSLDDMMEQSQWYEFSVSEDPSSSRKTMRVVEPVEVKVYLEKRRLRLEEDVEKKKTSLQLAEANLEQFDTILATLTI